MRTLVVFTDPEILRFTEEFFRHRGHETVGASNLQELFDLSEEKFDLAVCDWRLQPPVRQEVIDLSRARKLYLLLVCVDRSPGAWKSLLNEGAQDFTVEPHDPVRLAERLQVAEHEVQRFLSRKQTKVPEAVEPIPEPPLDSHSESPAEASNEGSGLGLIWEEQDDSDRGRADEEESPDIDPDAQRPLVEQLSSDEIERAIPERIEPLHMKRESTDQDSKTLYKRSQLFVLDSIWRAEQDQLPDLATAERLINEIVESLVSGSTDLLLESTNRAQEYSVSAHSVNVAVLGVRLAQGLKLPREQLIRIGLAGLLHELGVVKLPADVVHQTETLDEDIKAEMRQRPLFSAQILEGLGEDFGWLAEIVGQVFEREDGSGEPMHLGGDQIRLEAKILGIVDVFDACIHIRPYRGALTAYQLLTELTTREVRSFSPGIVKALLKSLTLYPYNEYVVLNTGEVARVVDVQQDNLSRPVVDILYGESGAPQAEPKTVRLADNPSLFITKAVTVDAIPASG